MIIEGFANPIALILYPSEDPIKRTIILTIVFVIGTFIEYIILKKGINEILFFSCIKINLVTFPLTQILAYIISIYLWAYFWFYVLGIEILVIIIEWLLLRIELSKALVLSRNILHYTAMANLISFLLGLCSFVFFPSSFL